VNGAAQPLTIFGNPTRLEDHHQMAGTDFPANHGNDDTKEVTRPGNDCYIAIENGHRNSEFVPLNMVIFHSYVNVYQAGYAAMLHGTANSFMLQSPTLRYRSTAE